LTDDKTLQLNLKPLKINYLFYWLVFTMEITYSMPIRIHAKLMDFIESKRSRIGLESI